MKKIVLNVIIISSCAVSLLYCFDDLFSILSIKGILEEVILYSTLILAPTGFVASLYAARQWKSPWYIFSSLLLGLISLVILFLILLITA